MIRSLMAAPLLAAFAAGAQANTPTDVPRHKCDKPEFPGQRMMQEPGAQKKLQREVDAYKACIKAYADERNAAAKSQLDAANAAITEYNDAMKALTDAQTR